MNIVSLKTPLFIEIETIPFRFSLGGEFPT